MKTGRIVVYPKDVQLITGRTERYGRKLLTEIKASLKKEEHHFVSIEEFCKYTGLGVDEVRTLIND